MDNITEPTKIVIPQAFMTTRQKVLLHSRQRAEASVCEKPSVAECAVNSFVNVAKGVIELAKKG